MIKLLFTGDLSCTGKFKTSVENNREIFSNQLLSLFKDYSHVICNFEGAATNLKNIYRSDCDLRSPDKSIEYFQKRNILVYNLANNHVFDCGYDGFKNTKDKILKGGGIYFGAGKNIEEASRVEYISKDDITIGLIGVCHKEGLIASKNTEGVFCDIYEDYIRSKIIKAKTKCDWLILNYHGGEEYTRYPMPKKRSKLKKYLNYGVDVIIGHHPHVVQGIEKIDNKFIFYSLGNFIFDIEQQRNKKYISDSVLLDIRFTKSKITYSNIPIKIDASNEKIFIQDAFKGLKGLSRFSNYTRRWQQECYRVVCMDDPLKSLKFDWIKKIFKRFPLLIIIGNFVKIKRLMYGWNYRPVLYGAFIFYLKTIFKYDERLEIISND